MSYVSYDHQYEIKKNGANQNKITETYSLPVFEISFKSFLFKNFIFNI